MNTILYYYNDTYTCIDNYNFNFSKMIIDTKLKFSTYTYILTSYPKIYHILLYLKIL